MSEETNHLKHALDQFNPAASVLNSTIVDAVANLVYREANGLTLSGELCIERSRLRALLAFPEVRVAVIGAGDELLQVDGRTSVAEALGVTSRIPFQFVSSRFRRPVQAAHFLLHNMGGWESGMRGDTFSGVLYLLARRYKIPLLFPGGSAEDADHPQTALMLFIEQQFLDQQSITPLAILVLAIIQERDQLLTAFVHGKPNTSDIAAASAVYQRLRTKAHKLLAIPRIKAQVEAFITECYFDTDKTLPPNSNAKIKVLNDRINQLARINGDLQEQIVVLRKRVNRGPLDISDLPRFALGQLVQDDRLAIDGEISQVQGQIRDIANSPERDNDLMKYKNFLTYLRAAVDSPVAQTQLEAWRLLPQVRAYLHQMQAEMLNAKAELLKLIA